jgi:hypothetical protein
VKCFFSSKFKIGLWTCILLEVDDLKLYVLIKTFHYSGTTLWNFLPVTLEESKSLEHFKRNSKIYFPRNQEKEFT